MKNNLPVMLLKRIVLFPLQDVRLDLSNDISSRVIDLAMTKHNGEILSYLEVSLITGRTHQIRVQFASRGLSLCGDRRYGAPAESGKSLALCSTELGFTHPKTKKEMHFSYIPEGMREGS